MNEIAKFIKSNRKAAGLTQKEFVPSGAITILSNLPYEESILQNEDTVGALRIDKSKKRGIINGEESRLRSMNWIC